ncbi:glycosyltransferase family 39 protein [Selenomonas sp. F0473]|uniref:ArnT family glycosyltransferase n=1 Tax=Selenomonas sp. F0473 TaxID=999423 RepID=UPI00029DFFD2|nr:glycosyltransferase family 39 protein [Selenomonas sp. F0473]EKU72041.1 hypothetical protein HMPREF9161_00726 [Selenomonas sp. F0473]
MNDEKTLAWPAYLLLLVIISFQILYGIGGTPMLDPDEPVYAETAKEMIRFGDYLSPRIYNEYWYDKPPIFYWMVVASLKLFGGFSEFAARLPAALMAIGAVLMTALSSARLFGARTGFWAGIVMGTSVMLMYMGKASVTDTTLLFFLTAALFSFIHRHYWLMYLACGLAVMTKGPIGVVFPAGIVFFYLLVTHRLEQILRMHVARGLLIVVTVGLPWYAYMYDVHGMAFVQEFIGFHNVGRFTAPLHPVRAHWWFYLPVLILGFFPWTGLLVQSVKNAFYRSFGEEAQQLAFFQVWWIFVLVFFSIAQTKQVSYMLLLTPALSTIIAWNLARMLDDWRETHFSWAGGSAVMFLAVGLGWLMSGDSLAELAEGGLWLGALTLVLGALIVYSITASHHLLCAAWLHAGAGILTMAIAFGVLMPAAAGHFSVKQVALHYAREYRAAADAEGRVLYVDKQLRPGVMLYTDIPGIEADTNNAASLAALREDTRPKYIIMRDYMYQKMKAELGAARWQLVENHDGLCIYRDDKE